MPPAHVPPVLRPYNEGSGPYPSLRRGDAITEMKRHVFPFLGLIELAVAVALVLLGLALPGRDDVRDSFAGARCDTGGCRAPGASRRVDAHDRTRGGRAG